jgi:broad specificity phosphatase PhoE
VIGKQAGEGSGVHDRCDPGKADTGLLVEGIREVMASTSGDPAEPAGRTVVYLARHGQTPLNESGVLRGLADPSLDETGQHQARRLAAALGSRQPSAVVASPLRRAIQTAQPVADRAGLDVVTDQRLIDRDYGPLTGVSKNQVLARWGSVDDAPGVEPASAVGERAVAGLTDIARRYRGATVVVVSHDAVNRQVLAAFDPGLGDPGALPQDNGCFNHLELRENTWVVLTVNEIPDRS